MEANITNYDLSYGMITLRRRWSSEIFHHIKPHTAVVVCCAVGFAAKRSPTTRREHELEISKTIPDLDR
jgi:hypothetical protein